MRATGRRLPDEWLPHLMALARRADDAAAYVELGGTRAAWLARTLPELAGDVWWGTGEDWDEAWAATETGAAKAAVVRRIRQSDLPRARAALATWWASIPSVERARVLEAVEVRVEPADEPFLAEALTDRRSDVRTTAAGLLVLLPDSALTRRIEDEARPLLVTGGLVRKGLKVTLPSPSEEFANLGFTNRPDAGYGERAWLLRSLLAHVRPERWSEWLRVDPSGLVDQASRSDEARPLLEGWIEASARFRDRDWAAAILRNAAVRTKVMLNVGRVLDGLTPADRAIVVAEAAEAIDPVMLASFVADIPAPWPRPLADAVLNMADSRRAGTIPGTRAVRARTRRRAPPATRPSGRLDQRRVVQGRAPTGPHRCRRDHPPSRPHPRGVLVRATPSLMGDPMTTTPPAVLRAHAEQAQAHELEALARLDEKQRPSGWRLSPWAVVTFVMGGKLKDGTAVTPKYIGDRRLVEIAVATLATDRALLLLGVPGTAKSWLSEHLAAAISGDSTLLVQGTAGTGEEAIRYGWNYARLLAEGPSRAALVASPVMVGMAEGKQVRIEELTRIPSDVQDALITILSEKSLPIAELGEEVQAVNGFNVIATANNRDRGVNELSSALRRRFNTVVLPLPASVEEEVQIVQQRVGEMGRALDLPAEAPALEEIRRIVTIFRELRSGQTEDGKNKLKVPSATLSTAEAIAVVNQGLSLAGHFGEGRLKPNDIAAGLTGAIIRDPVQDAAVWREYLETVMKERDGGWRELYKACREEAE